VIYELDPVEAIALAAVGEPGKRQFFLLASGQGRTLTLACEKSQVQALVARLHQMMEAQGIETAAAATGPSGLAPSLRTGSSSVSPFPASSTRSSKESWPSICVL